MPVHQLPEIFFGGQPADAALYVYHTGVSSQHNRVNFSRNLLCFVLEGEKEVTGSTGHVSIGNSDILLLRTGHTLMTERTSANASFKSILFFFSDDMLLSLLPVGTGPGAPGKHAAKRLFAFPKDKYILNFEQSLLLLDGQKPVSEKLLRSKLEEILLYLADTQAGQLQAFAQSVLSEHSELPFRRFIETQDKLNLGIGELAFLCNMSVSAFKRKFAEVFHTSPGQYFIARKMQKALQLLRQHKRASEIADELGYTSLPAFSSEFKKHFGHSPRDYIQNGLLK